MNWESQFTSLNSFKLIEFIAQWTEGIKPVEDAKIGLTVPSYMEIDSIEDLEPNE